MKKGVLFLFFCIIYFVSNAQLLVPDFEMPFYFEDSRGNKDTIVIGLDRRADYQGKINTSFGEKIISTPFDSVFEVRVRHDASANFYPYSKKIIMPVEPSVPTYCYGGGYSIISVYSKYPPIKITWNNNLLNGITKEGGKLNGTFFCSNSDLPLIEPPFPTYPLAYYCMAPINEIEDNLKKIDNPNALYKQLTRSFEVQGKGLVDLPSYYCAMQSNCISTYPCPKVDNHNINNNFDLEIFPNPSNDIININFLDSKSLLKTKVFGEDRKVIFEKQYFNTSHIQLDITKYNSGIYYFFIEDDKGVQQRKSFINLSSIIKREKFDWN